MDALAEVEHAPFTYVHIPADINSPVEVLNFSGKEHEYRSLLVGHFTRHELLPEERDSFKNYIKTTCQENQPQEETKPAIDKEFLNNSVNVASNNYQIIPLTLPTRHNGFLGINCYIDSIGRVKNLPTNSRATRICSTDIRGECFISKTFDDEDKFARVDFTMEDYQRLLTNPPDPTNRWDSGQALAQMLNPDTQKALPQRKLANEVPNHCENCKTQNEKLKTCSQCKKVRYCSVACQKKDWKYHRRICTLHY